jgi:hypothetical protein
MPKPARQASDHHDHGLVAVSQPHSLISGLEASRALADLAEKLRAAAAADVKGIADEASHGW